MARASTAYKNAGSAEYACPGDDVKKRLENLRSKANQHGGMGYVLLWLLGVPIPVLILISLLRGCS